MMREERRRKHNDKFSLFFRSTSYISGNQYLPAYDTNEIKETRGNEGVQGELDKRKVLNERVAISDSTSAILVSTASTLDLMVAISDSTGFF